MNNRFRFAVAFSYTRAHRHTIRNIAELVRQHIDGSIGDPGEGHVFYDEWFQHEIVGVDMDVRLQSIYLGESMMVISDLSALYADTEWARIEAKAIRALKKKLDSARRDCDRLRFLSIRFDRGNVPGCFETEGYLDASRQTPREMAITISKRYDKLLQCGWKLEERAVVASATHSESSKFYGVSPSIPTPPPLPIRSSQGEVKPKQLFQWDDFVAKHLRCLVAESLGYDDAMLVTDALNCCGNFADVRKYIQLRISDEAAQRRFLQNWTFN